GKISSTEYTRTIQNCYHEKIIYREDNMHKSFAGYATTKKDGKFTVVVNRSYDLSAKYSTLVHELAHIYSGHLGILGDSWWQSRTFTDKQIREIEAESI